MQKASGKPYTAIHTKERSVNKTQLKTLLKKAGLSAKDVLRTKEDLYHELGLAKKQLSDEELLDLMVKHPDLIQRPIVEKGDQAMLARPADSIKKLL
jgi:arsenate reductase